MKKIIIYSIAMVSLIFVSYQFFNDYWALTTIKLFLMAGLPLVLFCRQGINDLFKFDKRGKIIIISLVLMGLIFAGYAIFSNFIDMGDIPRSTSKKYGISLDSYYAVMLYIPIVNALVEEFFFRGLLYLRYREVKGAMVISSVIFSIYHLPMIVGWYSHAYLALTLFFLFVSGLIFCQIAKRTNGIVGPYIVHMSANLAINSIGLFLFIVNG